MNTDATARDRVRMLAATTTGGARPSGAAVDLRSRSNRDLVASSVLLPDGVALWRHVHPSSRELQRVSYDGSVLVVHNTEPAGSSFLVHDELGQARSRRGPAITLHRPEDSGHDELLVVFCDDLAD
jgi:hypothetical protein